MKQGFTGIYIIFLISAKAVLTSTYNLYYEQKISEFFFLSENFQFLEVNLSIYLNRRILVMNTNDSFTATDPNLFLSPRKFFF